MLSWSRSWFRKVDNTKIPAPVGDTTTVCQRLAAIAIYIYIHTHIYIHIHIYIYIYTGPCIVNGI